MTNMNVTTEPAENHPFGMPVRDVMESNYLDYAMSVITSRALPDARDGLKPVHRRILYAMHALNIGAGGPHKKSARVVGEVIGKYHPHGDSSVYGAAVRMSQSWMMRHPLVDGQGNFGSIDGDFAAAMRYTEMRLTRLGQEMFTGINKDTVDFRENYDGTEEEPVVLPVAYPNLWVNGSDGIAVGMATTVPPHNLRETINAFLAWLENEDISYGELAQIIPGPDLPTGGLVHGIDGYISALKTGRGKVKVRARWHQEDRKSGTRMVVTEIPYQVNKSKLVSDIASLVEERIVEGIVDLRDESNKKGIRIVLDIKNGYDVDLIANRLLSKTNLETSINYNVLALVGQQPTQMNLKMIFDVFRKHRIEVIQRRTQFDLNKTLERLHLLEGFLKALDRLDETLAAIRSSTDPVEARGKLEALLAIDAVQAQAILDMRLQRLTGMQIQDIRDEHARLTAQAEDLRDILATPSRQIDLLKKDIEGVRALHGEDRRSEIAADLSTVTREDLIKDEDVVVMATQNGFLKRVAVSALKRQNRGTKGRSIMDVGEDDLVTAIHTASTRDYLLAVTDSGQVQAVKTYLIPESGVGNKGRHYRNIFDGMADNAQVVAMLSVSDLDCETTSLVIATDQGYIKRSALALFTNATRKGGVSGISLAEGEAIVSAQVSTSEDDTALLVGSHSLACQFKIGTVRQMGRSSRGVRGINLPLNDRVIAAAVVPVDAQQTAELVCIGELGIGKRTQVKEFGVKGRGGKGMACFGPAKRSGLLAAATVLYEKQDLVVFNETGGGNRVSGTDVQKTGRASTGAAIMRNGKVCGLIAVPPEEEPDLGSEEQVH